MYCFTWHTPFGHALAKPYSHRVVDDPEERRHRSHLIVRRSPGNELDHGTADGPDVGGCCEARHLNNLWRHPIGSANHRIGLPRDEWPGSQYTTRVSAHLVREGRRGVATRAHPMA
eukprot:scaffold88981_cov32-Tisochrysis_lutea.AAC.7